ELCRTGIAGFTLGDAVAVRHDVDAIGYVENFLQAMRHEDDRRPLLQLADIGKHEIELISLQYGRGLVQQNYRMMMRALRYCERLAYFDELSLCKRQGSGSRARIYPDAESPQMGFGKLVEFAPVIYAAPNRLPFPSQE